MDTDPETGAVDDVTREILRHRFDAIANGMQTSLIRSSYSDIVKETEDASAAIFDREGRTIEQSVSNPSHLGMLIPAVGSILEEFDPETMFPGDVYFMNDPYDGGTHLPDLTVLRPVFADGEVIAFGVCMSHHQDVGGMTPGSIPTHATEIYQEGIRFPPLQLYDAGEENETAFKILRQNVRVPEVVVGDLNAQIAACTYAERRLAEIAEDIGVYAFADLVERLIRNAEERTRAILGEIPDGEYGFHDYLDDDGINHEEAIKIKATVTIDGSDVTVDFTGSADQVDGPVNSVPGATLSSVYYVIRAITDPEIPNNAGCFEPISVHLPERSVVNPSPPAPVNARSITIHRIANVLMGAFSKATPERTIACSSNPSAILSLGGTADDEQWVVTELTSGGMGARPTKDGVSCISLDISNIKNIPAEALEMDYPLRVLEFNLWEDSGGAGRFRGGLGGRRRIEIRQDGVTMTHRRDRFRTQPWGVRGGRPAPKARTVIHREESESIHSKMVMTLDDGDEIDLYLTGGGGYGSPLDRPVEAVREDLANGLITSQRAEETYGIVFADDGDGIDEGATRRHREERRKETTDEPTFDRGELPPDAT